MASSFFRLEYFVRRPYRITNYQKQYDGLVNNSDPKLVIAIF